MERPIEFRGINKKFKTWAYGYYVKIGNTHWIAERDVEFRTHELDEASYEERPETGIYGMAEILPETVGQFIDKKDKNGKKKVYVDDDIYFSTSQTQHYKGYVKWSEKGLCYVVECYWQKQDEMPHLCDGFEMKHKYKNTCVMRLDSECFDIEVIGDSHTTPLEDK